MKAYLRDDNVHKNIFSLLLLCRKTNYINAMKRLESQEDYLEKILQISKEKENVHAIDIARALSFSKPSVSLAMNKLKELGYIEINVKGEISLTKEGLAIAERH